APKAIKRCWLGVYGNVLKVTKSGCLSHVGRRTASLRTSCAVPGSVGGAEKADCVALRRPAACGVSKNRRERSQADADSWNGLFDTQDGPQRAYRAYRFKGAILLGNPQHSSRWSQKYNDGVEPPRGQRPSGRLERFVVRQ